MNTHYIRCREACSVVSAYLKRLEGVWQEAGSRSALLVFHATEKKRPAEIDTRRVDCNHCGVESDCVRRVFDIVFDAVDCVISIKTTDMPVHVVSRTQSCTRAPPPVSAGVCAWKHKHVTRTHARTHTHTRTHPPTHARTHAHTHTHTPHHTTPHHKITRQQLILFRF